jgi:hypothetical protein
LIAGITADALGIGCARRCSGHRLRTSRIAF